MTYKVNFPIVGPIEQSSAQQLYSNQGIIRGQAYIQTTDNVQTTLFTLPIPTSVGTAIRLNFSLLAGEDNGAKAAGHIGFHIACAFYNGSSSTTLVSPTISFTTAGGSFAVAAAYSLSGNNMLIRVTGIAATTINWVMNYEYFSINI